MALLLGTPTINPQSPSPADTDASATEDSLVAHCVDIESLGSNYNPLESACKFALSPRNLPNYVCQERTERFINDRHLDVVTADVTFLRGHGDRYTNIAIDGQAVDSLKGREGWISFELFGNQLTTIFLPETKAQFKLKREVNTHADPEDVFDFRFMAANNSRFRLLEIYPGLAGTITVDRTYGRLERVDSKLSDAPKGLRVSFYNSVVNYGEVSIPELGNVLTPVNAEVQACFTAGACFRNVLTFSNCRKFGSTARIVPDAENGP